MQIGDLVANFEFLATSEMASSLRQYYGQWIVLYFYPKDATPGCTLEGQDFNRLLDEFSACNTVVFGISRDSLSSHERFKKKQGFLFELISDPDEKICRQFDVIKMKSMYGKQVQGIERSTFLISPKGELRFVWRKVSAKGHADEVLTVTKKQLQSC